MLGGDGPFIHAFLLELMWREKSDGGIRKGVCAFDLIRREVLILEDNFFFRVGEMSVYEYN